MNRIIKLVILLFLLPLFSVAQMSTLQISAPNSVSVINNYDAMFIQADINNATYKVTKSVTIFNKQGEGYGYFHTYGDKFRELKEFSGVVKNASGAVIRKIGKKDLISSSVSDQMASDDYLIMYECKVPTYPYTVEYTYQEKWKNGIIGYPSFDPIDGYMQSVTKATYRIEVPAGMDLRYKSNFDCQIKDETVGDKHVYTFSADNIAAIEKEPLAPLFREFRPSVRIAPSDFCYDSYCGSMASWKSLGEWTSILLKGRDVLPDAFSQKLIDMTKDAASDREKVEILYKYLQNNWRYVSIQLGIGGFQPIDAMSVSKTNYGDCKGLSNLMKAMLKVVGISSNYCEIYMGDKKYFSSDFSNENETNHVILLVPLKNDSIWLECTSQKLPFGFVHDKIAGHDALVITENGGQICRLPVYPDELNKRQSSLTLDISEDGVAKGTVTLIENLHEYDRYVGYMTSKDRQDVIRYLNSSLRFPKVQYGAFNVEENKSSMPSCTLTTTIDAGEFANRTGSRLFVPVCPLDKREFSVFTSNNRNLDIVVNQGYSQADTIIYNIPEGYNMESTPKDISIKSPFGTFKTSVRQEGNQVIYIQNTDVFSGRHDKAVYPLFKAFYEKISSASKQKIVLKKA